ncbi:hypothetical protein MAR_007050 [Mya arenaria]|uniref:Uncharacterized protein n=1 Tax=Mya arenaria TaxID=6604 RepID=A0ABY7DDV0_MYAAR|nr:hypothetical protein MAR_007050 [Mya arenaria]
MDVRQMAVEMENQPGLQMVAPLPTDYSTNITLKLTTLSAEMFRRFVNMVIKARHSVICTLDYCTIKEDIRQVKAEMENQPLLKVREFNEKTAGGFREIWVPTHYLFEEGGSITEFTCSEWNEWDEV